MIAALLLLALQAPQQPPKVEETIEVRRTIIDAHVHDADYEQIDDLEAKDFQVLVDGKEAPIESVTWVSELPGVETIFNDSGEELSRSTVEAPGRLFVVFVQTDFGRNHDRVIGEMGVLQSFHALLQTLQKSDRVALFSFDSHLKFRLDFTTDRALLEKVFPSVIAIDQPSPPAPAEPPSLSSLLTAKELAGAGSSESALILLARALRRIDGSKTILLLGWGMGDVIEMRPIITAQTLRAAAELASARVTVHAFNFGIAHQMGAGLMEVAADTGGFYVAGPATGPFSQLEHSFIPKLESMLAGHYEIEIRSPVPVDFRKVHRLEVHVRRNGYTVITKNGFVDVP